MSTVDGEFPMPSLNSRGAGDHLLPRALARLGLKPHKHSITVVVLPAQFRNPPSDGYHPSHRYNSPDTIKPSTFEPPTRHIHQLPITTYSERPGGNQQEEQPQGEQA